MIHPLLTDRRALGLFLLAWLLSGIVLGLPATGSAPGQWRPAALSFLPPFLVFGFLCLGAWYPCRANPLAETSLARLAAVHLSAALVSSLGWFAMAVGWNTWIGHFWPRISLEHLAPHAPRLIALGALLYLLVTTLCYLLLAFEESRRAEARALELRVLAREAELAAFERQIDPHFLFNCLNSISALCASRPDAAREMAIRLGEFLRASLRLTERQLIPLAEELELAERFLAIERTRFGERLAVERHVDPAVLGRPVPALLLQPLLENAIKHGLAHLVDGGRIEIAARSRGDRLELELVNPVATGAPETAGDGIGLRNVAGRLELLYDGRARFEVAPEEDRFQVRIELPLELSEAEAEIA